MTTKQHREFMIWNNWFGKNDACMYIFGMTIDQMQGIDQDQKIHVIEYSAVTELEAKLSKKNLDYTNLSSMYESRIYRIIDLEKKLDEKDAEIERLRIKILKEREISNNTTGALVKIKTDQIESLEATIDRQNKAIEKLKEQKLSWARNTPASMMLKTCKVLIDEENSIIEAILNGTTERGG